MNGQVSALVAPPGDSTRRPYQRNSEGFLVMCDGTEYGFLFSVWPQKTGMNREEEPVRLFLDNPWFSEATNAVTSSCNSQSGGDEC